MPRGEHDPKKQKRWTARKRTRGCCKPKSTATTAHAEAPACPRPAGTLALASLYSCSASLSSFLAFSSFVSASLSFVSISSTFSLLLALYSCSHRSHKAATTLSALTTALSALSRARRAAAKSCQVQGCFPVFLRPCLPNTSVCRLGWSLVLQSCLLQLLVLHRAKATVCNGIFKQQKRKPTARSEALGASSTGSAVCAEAACSSTSRRAAFDAKSKTHGMDKQTWPYLRRPHFPKAPKPALSRK